MSMHQELQVQDNNAHFELDKNNADSFSMTIVKGEQNIAMSLNAAELRALADLCQVELHA